VIVFSKSGLGSSAVGHMTASMAPFWLALYCMGAGLIVVGLLKLSPRAEVVGLIFFAATMVTDGVAVLAYTGGGGAAGAFVFIALAFAALWRVHEVWKLVTAAAHRTGEHGP
jgi:FtsH-binding integral membrane protein